MAKAIRVYKGKEKLEVISRRIKGNTKGLGYWSAIEAEKHLGKVKVESKTETPSSEG